MKKIIMKVFSNPFDRADAITADAEIISSVGCDFQFKCGSFSLETEDVVVYYRLDKTDDNSFRGYVVDHLWFVGNVIYESKDRIGRLVKVKTKESEELKSNVPHIYEIVEQVGGVSKTYRTTDKQTFMEIYNND